MTPESDAYTECGDFTLIYAASAPLVGSDIALFKAWGFSGDVLQRLALLQGIRIEP